MATILKLDETFGVDAGTNDTSGTLAAGLVSALDTAYGSNAWASLLTEKAERTGQLTFGTDTIDVAFTNSSGAPLVGVDSGLLTIDGKKIFLYTAADNNLVIGRVEGAGGLADPNGQIVLAIYLETLPSGDANATSADLWVLEIGTTLQHNLNGADPNDFVALTNKLFVTVTNPISFDATNAPSGSSLFVAYGDGTPLPTEVGVIVTAVGASNQSVTGNISSGEVVKASQAGKDLGGATFGVGSQQFNGPGGSGRRGWRPGLFHLRQGIGHEPYGPESRPE